MTGNANLSRAPGTLGSKTADPDNPETDHDLAQEVAVRAGHVLVELRARLSISNGAELRLQGDSVAHETIASALRAARPHDAILSEEAADDPRRLHGDRVWIVDPLDGTREFGEAGRDDWAVHVALWQDGDLAAGAVVLPAQNVVLSTAMPLPLPPRRPGAMRLMVSRTRAPAIAHELSRRLGAALVPLGSAGAKVAAVVQGQADAYVHAGGQHEWDSAAPVVVARHAGLRACRLDGSALRYNQPDTSLPDLLVCRPEAADEMLAAIPPP